SLDVAIDPGSLFHLRPRVHEITLMHATARLHSASAADPDTLPPEDLDSKQAARQARAEKLQRSAGNLIRVLLIPARESPHIIVRDVALLSSHSDETQVEGMRLAWLESMPHEGG